MEQEKINERIKFLQNRIDALDKVVHQEEATANHFYDPSGKNLKGWNTLLGNRDKTKKLIEADYAEIAKLEKQKQ